MNNFPLNSFNIQKMKKPDMKQLEFQALKESAIIESSKKQETLSEKSEIELLAEQNKQSIQKEMDSIHKLINNNMGKNIKYFS